MFIFQGIKKYKTSTVNMPSWASGNCGGHIIILYFIDQMIQNELRK